jgi:hypothetical protein
MKYLIFIICILVFSCKRKPEFGPNVIPNSLFFLLTESSNRLPDSILNSIKISYIKQGNKYYINDLIRATGSGYDIGVMTTRSVAFVSANDNIKNFNIEYYDGSSDDLFIDYIKLDLESAKKNSCFCYYPRNDIRFKNTSAILDSNIKEQQVYRFNK